MQRPQQQQRRASHSLESQPHLSDARLLRLLVNLPAAPAACFAALPLGTTTAKSRAALVRTATAATSTGARALAEPVALAQTGALEGRPRASTEQPGSMELTDDATCPDPPPRAAAFP